MTIPIDTIICGNAKDIIKQLPDNCIDLVFTDPPYLKQYSYTYDILADECPRVMKRGASLITIAAHYALEYIMLAFNGKLKYRWLLNMDQSDGPHARMAMGIEVLYKPMLWYVKEAYPQGRGFLKDSIKIIPDSGVKKQNHKWEQDESWAEYYISKLSKENDVVLDPYCGSGTVPAVCKRLKRHYIAIDINEQCCRITKQRLDLL